jgi:hypothetical protein
MVLDASSVPSIGHPAIRVSPDRRLIHPLDGVALNLLPPDGLMLALVAVTTLFLTAAIADFRAPARAPLLR